MRNRSAQKLAAILVMLFLMAGLIMGSVNDSQNLTNSSGGLNISQNNSGTVLVSIDSLNGSVNKTRNSINTTQGNITTENTNLTTNKTTQENISADSGATYKPIESVNSAALPLEENMNTTNTSEKKIQVSLVENNKVQIEGDLPESFNINNIQKQDIQENASSQQVVVSSPVHVTDPLTVYADIPEISPNQTSSVKIYWKNENKSITPTGFYDTNNDGLYDRVSWIVPHLSTQIFQVSVTPQTTTNTSNTIKINVTYPENGHIFKNSLANFSVKINYTNPASLSCNLTINPGNKLIKNINQGGATNISLPQGSYTWIANCTDTNNNAIKGNQTGNFIINQSYSVSQPQSLYVIDGNNNIIADSGTNTTVIIRHPGNSLPLVTVSKDGTASGYYQDNYTGTILNLSSILKTYGKGAGNYTLIVKPAGQNSDQIIRRFSVAQVNLTLPNGAYTYNNTAIRVSLLTTGTKKLTSVVVEFGDGTSNITYFNLATPTDSFTETFNHIYTSVTSYNLKLTYYFSGENPQTLTKTISVHTSNDTSGPTISLITPANNQIIYNNAITFSYRATDPSGIGNCTTDIYYYQNGYGSLNYSRTDNPTSGNAINIPLTEFSPGDYSWDVKCYDTKGNFMDYDPNGGGYDFTVSYNQTLSTYGQKDAIENTLNALDNFSTSMNSYSLDQLQALDDLGLTGNLSTYFPKRLAQIKQFFETNQSSMISNLVQRQKAIDQNTNDLNYISSHIPENITINNQQEFTKNSMSSNMESIVEAYMNANDITLHRSEINALAQRNMDIQKYLNVLTNARQVTIDYPNSTQAMTLVTEQVNISNESIGNIIVVLPSDANNVTFITPATKLTDSVYEISTDQVQNSSIIYYFPKTVQPSVLKQSDTVLFQNFAVKYSGITGFIPLISGGSMPPWYYIVIFLVVSGLIFGGVKVKGKMDMEKWKKEENVERIMQDIERAKESLRDNDDTEAAKEAYHRIKGLFALVPEGFRKYVLREITMIQKGIDRRDVISFVKEYEKAKYQGREGDADKLYQQIKMTYKRLPKKDQEKIYNKLFRRTFDY